MATAGTKVTGWRGVDGDKRKDHSGTEGAPGTPLSHCFWLPLDFMPRCADPSLLPFPLLYGHGSAQVCGVHWITGMERQLSVLCSLLPCPTGYNQQAVEHLWLSVTGTWEPWLLHPKDWICPS